MELDDGVVFERVSSVVVVHHLHTSVTGGIGDLSGLDVLRKRHTDKGPAKGMWGDVLPREELFGDASHHLVHVPRSERECFVMRDGMEHVGIFH